MTNFEIQILLKQNKYYITDVFNNYYNLRYKFICERFRITQSDCDELEKIFNNQKTR